MPEDRPQRARGVLHVAAHEQSGQTRLADLRQEGCLKACLTRTTGTMLEAVLLNTSGGLTDGDILRTSLVAGARASFCVTSQAAERVYRGRPECAPARVTAHVTVADDAYMEYLPQETILFERCALSRRLAVDLAPAAAYLGCEMLVFGRAASGETVQTGDLRDIVEIRRDGRLIFRDGVVLQGDWVRALAGSATASGAAAVASIVAAGPAATALLSPLGTALAAYAVRSGASSRDGMVMARIVGGSARAVRLALIAGLEALRGGAPLPRVWQC